MNQIFCSNCGQNIPANSNFCKYCGAAQHGEDAGAYRVQAPVMESAEAAVAQNKSQGSKTPPEMYPLQQLGVDAFMYFFFANIAKTILLVGLLVAGAFLMPKLFILFFVVYLVSIFIGTALMYNNFQFEINEKGVEIQMGVIHKTEVSVPYDSIENVNIERTITDRMLGIARVSIETAGSPWGTTTNGAQEKQVRAEAYLPGLTFARAKRIHDLLIDGSDGIFGN
jgi:membrane protein YdbS with pleckstrin-like domain